jgi:hypothetical protein
VADRAPASGKIPSDLIPQADRVERVVAVLAFISEHGRRPIEGETQLEISKRHLDYACHAARILGFLELADDKLARAGRILLTLAPDLQLLRLAFAFELSAVGQAWIAWSGKRELAEIDPGTAGAFLQDCAERADSTTTNRRKSTLRSWVNHFRELRHGEVGPNLDFGDWSPMNPPPGVADEHVNVFVAGASDRVVRALAPGSRTLRIASGFFTISGYLRLVETLTAPAMVNLLVGQDDKNPFARRSARDAAEILAVFRETLGVGPLDSNRRRETKRLHEHLLRTMVRIRAYEARKTAGLHAKVYLFDRRAAYVTSANLTLKGLQQNIEAGRVLMEGRHRADIEHFVDRFDELFARATSLSSEVVRVLEESWAFQSTISPYLFFLKVMREIYDRLPPVRGDSRKPLADFQRRIVKPLTARMVGSRKAMLVSPVGSGKTLMATHVAAYLHQEH